MQRYTEIPSSTTLAESLPLILNNDKSALSNNAGSAFPITNLWEGMLCYRTDLKKLYQCEDVTKPTWKVVADLSGDFRQLDGGNGGAVKYDHMNLNSWDSMPTGFYQGTGMLNQPEGDTSWSVLQMRQGNSDGYASQIAIGNSTGKICTRFQTGGFWSDWKEIPLTTSDGEAVGGLNADKVDGYEPGNARGQIPLNNGIINDGLSAQYLKGYEPGNESMNIPLNNGVVNLGLNADQLDSLHAGNEANQIPISNGKVCKNLNAEMLGGMKAEKFVTVDDNNNSNMDLNQANITNLNVTNLNFTNTNSHSVSGSSVSGRTASGTTAGGIDSTSTTYDGQYSDPGYYDYVSKSYTYNTNGAISSGSYNVMAIINKLATYAHYHTVSEKVRYYNCNCNCNCNCDCSDDNCS